MKKTVNNIKKAQKKDSVRNKRKNEVEQIVDAFYDLVSNLDFQEKIQKYRKQLNIPSNGFPLKFRDNVHLIELFYEPSQWKERFPRGSGWALIDKVMEFLVQKLGQDSIGLRDILRIYFFHNDINIDILYELAERQNVVSVEDNIKELEYYGHNPVVLKKYYEDKYKNYPVSIRVSPYASKEQLFSFIKNNLTAIKKIQGKYRISNIKLGKLRIRKNQANDINLFIAENYNEGNWILYEEIKKKFKVTMSLSQIRSRKNIIKNK